MTQRIKAHPDLVRALAKEGHSQSTIASLLDVSRERIRQICDRHGIETLSGLIDYDLEENIKAAIEDGLSVREAAAKCGCSAVAVNRAVERLGLRVAWKGKRPGASGIRGVGLHSPSGLWRACLYSNGRRNLIGYYRSKEEAARAVAEHNAGVPA